MRQLLILLIRMYQRVSRLTPSVCRFTPTCSEYAAQALQQYGVLKGGWMTLRRIGRCHPWNPGGFDPVPVLAPVLKADETPDRSGSLLERK